MDYELLESYIYDISTSVYDVLETLHPFYRYKLYGTIAEKRGLQPDCDLRELAENIVLMIPRINKDVKDGFEIASLSYEDLKESQKKNNKRLGRKANRARTNIRKTFKININDDEVQKTFDNDKKEYYESYKLNGFTVQDSIELKQKHNKSRDWSIAHSLDCSMRIANLCQNLCDSGWLLSLTLPGSFRGKTFEKCSEEINYRLNQIKKESDRQDIEWTGTFAIETHKDETQHIHILYYVKNYNEDEFSNKKTDRDKLLDIVFKYFNNEDRDNYQVNKPAYYAGGLLNYMFKDYGKQNTRHGFIGLRRDIKKIWNSLYRGNYGDKSLSYLSGDSLWIAKRYIHCNDGTSDFISGRTGFTLFALRAFRSERLNNHGNNNKLTVYEDERTSYLRRELNNRKYKKTHQLYKKTTNVRYVKFLFGYVYLYINQDCVLGVFYRFEIVKSFGQPPPAGRD
ncbi:hypothetical protein D5366_10445 [Neokomagataea tanensis]|uniref:Replication endonuclease n=3 Tax=Neokomagataea TaxID=1223423 RepID=A0A4Y6VB16_9PROT|nr:hypothetical protein [Neokomagataea tanensis]QDH25565.1 hypothetical protein D5366_10445 [Neokomagataea tanensis]